MLRRPQVTSRDLGLARADALGFGTPIAGPGAGARAGGGRAAGGSLCQQGSAGGAPAQRGGPPGARGRPLPPAGGSVGGPPVCARPQKPRPAPGRLPTHMHACSAMVLRANGACSKGYGCEQARAGPCKPPLAWYLQPALHFGAAQCVSLVQAPAGCGGLGGGHCHAAPAGRGGRPEGHPAQPGQPPARCAPCHLPSNAIYSTDCCSFAVVPSWLLYRPPWAPPLCALCTL